MHTNNWTKIRLHFVDIYVVNIKNIYIHIFIHNVVAVAVTARKFNSIQGNAKKSFINFKWMYKILKIKLTQLTYVYLH